MRIIIIGGGPGGYSAAIRGAQLGMEVVLVEAEALGGTCLNKGCIPTKALLQSSHLYSAIKSEEFGIVANDTVADINKIYERTFGIVSKLNNGIQALIKANAIEYHNKKASLVSDTAIKLENGEIIEGDKIILATGANPIRLPIKGSENLLTSDDFLSHNYKNYNNVIIIGAGVVGVEIATFFGELGSSVLLIDSMDSILSVMSEDIAKYISLSLRKKGVKFALGSIVQKVEKSRENYCVTYLQKEKEKLANADLVISAVGRAPMSIAGLDKTMATFDRGFIVNEQNKTAEDNIYAIGDCVRGNIQLAHYAAANGTRVVESFARISSTPLQNIPSCVYTSPNVGLVGKQEKDCNFEVEVGKFNMGANGKSMAEGGGAGYIKVVFDKESQRLIGAEMVCNSAAELSGFVANLINNGTTRENILSTVYPHPTLSEGFYEAVEDSIQKSIHTIYKKP